MFISEVWVSNW